MMEVEMKIRTLAWASALLAGTLVFFPGCTGSGSNSATLPLISDINGGVLARGTAGSIFVIDGTGFGTPSSGSSGYSVAFEDTLTASLVADAAVDLSTSGNWTDVFIKATVPNQLTAGTTYMVVVKTPNGTSNAVSFIVVASVIFSPSTILWSQSYSLPAAQQGFSTVCGTIGTGTSTYVYSIGGNTATSGTINGDNSNVDTVYMNQLNNADGTLSDASWTTLTSLPGPRGFAAAVFANSYNSIISGSAIYVVGGLDGTGAATSTVYYALPNSYGTIPASGSSGTWTATTALPQPLSAAAAVIFHGWIYVAGGNGSDGAPVTKVYSAKINADGTLGSWAPLTDLPVALAFHQLVEIAGTLYVLGGDSAATDPISDSQSPSVQDSVYYNAINIQTGAIGSAWTTDGNKLTKAREKFSAVGAGGYILVTGGLYGGNPGSSEESYASVNSDGSLSSFNGATGSHTIVNSSGYSLYNHSHFYVVDSSGNPHVLILGGADVDTGTLQAEVWYQH
jgi:hypothetical protein